MGWRVAQREGFPAGAESLMLSRAASLRCWTLHPAPPPDTHNTPSSRSCGMTHWHLQLGSLADRDLLLFFGSAVDRLGPRCFHQVGDIRLGVALPQQLLHQFHQKRKRKFLGKGQVVARCAITTLAGRRRPRGCQDSRHAPLEQADPFRGSVALAGFNLTRLRKGEGPREAGSPSGCRCARGSAPEATAASP